MAFLIAEIKTAQDVSGCCEGRGMSSRCSRKLSTGVMSTSQPPWPPATH